MDYRTGKCSQCGAEYKIPASFAHNVARCKLCKGVVHLGAPPAGVAVPRARQTPPPEVRAPAVQPPGEPQRSPVERAPRPTPPAPARPRPAPTPAMAAHAAVPARGAPAPRRRVAALVWLVLVVVLVVVAIALLRERRAGAETLPPAHDAAPTTVPPATPVDPGAQREEAPREEGAPASETGAPEPSDEQAALPAEPARDFDPTPDTSGEEWQEVQRWTDAWLAADADDESRRKLLAQGRKAVPALLNALRRQDCSTPAGLRGSERCQDALAAISNGARFDRNAPGADGCRHAAAGWASLWSRAEQRIEVWIELARLDEVDPAEAARLRERFGGLQPPEEPREDE